MPQNASLFRISKSLYNITTRKVKRTLDYDLQFKDYIFTEESKIPDGKSPQMSTADIQTVTFLPKIEQNFGSKVNLFADTDSLPVHP